MVTAVAAAAAVAPQVTCHPWCIHPPPVHAIGNERLSDKLGERPDMGAFEGGRVGANWTASEGVCAVKVNYRATRPVGRGKAPLGTAFGFSGPVLGSFRSRLAIFALENRLPSDSARAWQS